MWHLNKCIYCSAINAVLGKEFHLSTARLLNAYFKSATFLNNLLECPLKLFNRQFRKTKIYQLYLFHLSQCHCYQ